MLEGTENWCQVARVGRRFFGESLHRALLHFSQIPLPTSFRLLAKWEAKGAGALPQVRNEGAQHFRQNSPLDPRSCLVRWQRQGIGFWAKFADNISEAIAKVGTRQARAFQLNWCRRAPKLQATLAATEPLGTLRKNLQV